MCVSTVWHLLPLSNNKLLGHASLTPDCERPERVSVLSRLGFDTQDLVNVRNKKCVGVGSVINTVSCLIRSGD